MPRGLTKADGPAYPLESRRIQLSKTRPRGFRGSSNVGELTPSRVAISRLFVNSFVGVPFDTLPRPLPLRAALNVFTGSVNPLLSILCSLRGCIAPDAEHRGDEQPGPRRTGEQVDSNARTRHGREQ